jgi:fatty acid-binding protein DegV
MDGTIDAVDRARGKKKALQQLVSIVADKVQNQPVRIAVFHANAPETAVTVLNLCRDVMQIEQAYTLELSPVIGTHVGAGTVGIACYPKNVI